MLRPQPQQTRSESCALNLCREEVCGSSLKTSVQVVSIISVWELSATASIHECHDYANSYVNVCIEAVLRKNLEGAR